MPSHYRYEFSAHYRRQITLPIRLSNRPTNSLCLSTLSQIPRELAPMARWVHRAPRLGFLVFLRLVSLTRLPKQIIGGSPLLQIRQAHLRANPRHVSPTSQDCSQTPPFHYQEAIERSLASVSNRGQNTHPSCDVNIMHEFD